MCRCNFVTALVDSLESTGIINCSPVCAGAASIVMLYLHNYSYGGWMVPTRQIPANPVRPGREQR